VLIGHDHYGAKRRRWLGELPSMFRLMFRSLFDRRLPVSLAIPNKKDVMEILRGMLESGQLTPTIGKTFPLDAAPEALRALIQGDVVGRIVLTPNA
jgi:NADPH:quinone reductase-like Zn-dependent oxidoreductase